MIIDIHTHTFPEKIARKAVDKLASASHSFPFTDGTEAGLKRNMAESGVDISVVLPVATSAEQVSHINGGILARAEELSCGGGGPPASSEALSENRGGILSFGAMHPDFSGYRAELKRLKDAGIRGIKLHPPYQGYDFDDIHYLRILDAAEELSLSTIIHAGLDIGLPGVNPASPKAIENAVRKVRPKRLILAHMGGWGLWDEVRERLAGFGLYLDTSFALGEIVPISPEYYKTKEERQMLTNEEFLLMKGAFGAEKLLFGTDSPWGEQRAEIEKIRALGLPEDEEKAILGENAGMLLNLATEWHNDEA